MTEQQRRHRPKVATGKPAPDWLLDHGDLGFHALGPGADIEAEWIAAGLTLPNRASIRQYRLARVREQLRANDCAGALLYDPMNIRYATDTTNMSLWTMHNQVRYVFVATEGPVIVFEYSQGEFLDTHSEVVDEIRAATSFLYFYAGNRIPEIADRWAAELASLVAEHGRGSTRLAVDSLDIDGVRALERAGLDPFGGMPLLEDARSIKSPDEINAMRCAAHACEQAVGEMRAVFEPGITETALWAKLWDGNFKRYGEWVETRLLSSGPRTNPWYHEASSRVIENGDFMGFDTDLVGAYGACIDVSRTWIAGDKPATAQMLKTYDLAREQISRNLALHQPGASFHDISRQSWYPPLDEFNRYTCLSHGVGLCDEYPTIYVNELWDSTGYDGELRPGMVMSVESFVGPISGGQGVKLEEQILITETGHELLFNYSIDL